MKTRLLPAVAALSFACSAPARPAGPPIAAPPAAVPPSPPPPALAPPARPEPGLLGAACSAEVLLSRGDCSEGLLCAPFPGGYCASFCGLAGPCKPGGACAESIKAGDICMRSCATDADCRPGGYICDPVWKACTVPGFLAPKAPSCSAPPIARKTFGKAVQLSTARSPGAYTFEPAAVVGKTGAVIAAYVALGRMGEKNSLGLATLAPDGSVDGDHELGSDREDNFDPWMSADRHGNLHLVWLGFDGGHAPEKRMKIGLSTSLDGKVWSTPVIADDAATDCPGEVPGCLDKPMIAVGPDSSDPRRDAIYVAYSSDPGGGMKLIRSRDGGKTFSPSVLVGDGTYGDLEVSPTGDVHVVFVSTPDAVRPDRFGDARSSVVYRASTDGGKTFGSLRTVSAPGEPIPFYFSNPRVAADDPRKLLYVVYPEGTPDGRWDVVLATSRNHGATWSRIKVNDDAPCAIHMTPSIALDPRTGDVHVTWTENRSGRGGVAYARCASGGATCSASEAVNDQPFAAFSLARFTPRWLGEYNALLFDAKRRRLHAVFTATVEEAGSAVSRIFAASASVP